LYLSIDFGPLYLPAEIVEPSIREWKYFMKNVDEDFKDVEETDFMDDGVRIAIQKMEHFIEQRTLKNRK
jgi:hypothetical protein